MRRRWSTGLAVVVVAPLTVGVVSGASILDFDKWMQKIDQRSQEVQRSIARRAPDAAASDARELGP